MPVTTTRPARSARPARATRPVRTSSRPPTGRLIAALALTAGAVVACDDGPAGPSSPFPDITSAEVIATQGPIMRSLRVELEDSAAVEVFYETADGSRTFRMRSEPALSHDVLMPRLLADTEYRYAARVFDDGVGSDDVARGTFTTGPLPTDLQELDYTVEGHGTFELLMFQHRVDNGFRGFLAMEPNGSIVWYTTAVASGLAPTPIPGSHDIIMLTGEGVDGIARVSPRGHVVDSMPAGRVPNAAVHHDIAMLDEDRVAMIVLDDRTVRDTVVSGEAVWVWDMETGSVDKIWSSWDHFDWDDDRGPRSRPADWLHANALSLGPRGNLIMSLHYLDQIISIAPDYQSLEWRLGGTNATIPLSDEDQFRGQHSAFELDNGNILLFDNQYRAGSEEPAEYARGLEVAIDGESAHMVWEYVPDPPIWSRITSGIYLLENDHRLVTFSTPPDMFIVHEADETGQRVWRLSGDDLIFNFRSVPWTDIAGEVRVDAMP